MRTYPKEVIEALDKSIEKWDMVTHAGKVDKGIDDCPLCDLFFTNSQCRGCPVADATGRGGCSSTPYEDWVKKTKPGDRIVKNYNSAIAAYEFYDWLKRLRDDVEVEKPEFEPFTITISTLEEAQELWHRLNPPDVFHEYDPTSDYYKRRMPYPRLTLSNLWDQVNSKIGPELIK